MLKTRLLTKSYTIGDSSFRAVDSINLTIKAGEFVSIMGPSGSGKSTFLNLIGGLEKPTAGSILIDNQHIEELSEDELAVMRRDNVSYIYQFYSLVPELTAAENIILPLLIAGKKPAVWQKQLKELLLLVGLLKRKDHLPSQLSGGEQQRVAVARSLITNAKILLADEPTGSLDTRQSQAILEILRHLVDELKRTLILVTHDPKIAAYADRIIYFLDGKIVDESTCSPIQVKKIRDQLKQPSSWDAK